MTHTATAQVPTAHASKYLQQLCKHWQHNLAVAFTADHGTVTFPRDARGADWPGDGLVTFDAGESYELDGYQLMCNQNAADRGEVWAQPANAR